MGPISPCYPTELGQGHPKKGFFHPNTVLVVACSVAVLLAALNTPKSLQALCMPAPAEVVWSYPVDGDTDVPTNAMFWFLPSSSVVEVRLDGDLSLPEDPEPLPGTLATETTLVFEDVPVGSSSSLSAVARNFGDELIRLLT